MQPENNLIKTEVKIGESLLGWSELNTLNTRSCVLIPTVGVKQGQNLTQKAEWPTENLCADNDLMAHAGTHLLYLMWYTYMAPVDSLGDQQ